MTSTAMALQGANWRLFYYYDNPIPGDPDRVEDLGSAYRQTSDAYGDMATTIRKIQNGSMQGDAIDEFRSKVRELPPMFEKMSTSLGQVSNALMTWESDLNSYQERAWNVYQDYSNQIDVLRASSLNPQVIERRVNDTVQDARSALSQIVSDYDADSNNIVTRIKDAQAQGPELSWWESWIYSDVWQDVMSVFKWVVIVVSVLAIFVGGPILAAVAAVGAAVMVADSFGKLLTGQITLGQFCLDLVLQVLSFAPIGGVLVKACKSLKGVVSSLKGVISASEGFAKGAKQIATAVGKWAFKPTNLTTFLKGAFMGTKGLKFASFAGKGAISVASKIKNSLFSGAKKTWQFIKGVAKARQSDTASFKFATAFKTTIQQSRDLIKFAKNLPGGTSFGLVHSIIKNVAHTNELFSKTADAMSGMKGIVDAAFSGQSYGQAILGLSPIAGLVQAILEDEDRKKNKPYIKNLVYNS